MSGIMTAAVLGTLAVIFGAARAVAVIRGGRRIRALAAALPPAYPSARPLHGGITLHVLPCGCVYHYQRVQRDPCEPHAQLVADRAEINRLDQQIRRMS